MCLSYRFSVGGRVFFYDLCHRIETFKEHGKEDMNIPDMIFGFITMQLL